MQETANMVANIAAVLPEERKQERRDGDFSAAMTRPGQDLAETPHGLSRLRLGEVMIMLGLITSRDRDRVLELQGELAIPFGECCLRLNLIDAAALTYALSKQFGCHCPSTGSFSFHKDLATASHPIGPYAESLRSIAFRLMSRRVPGTGNLLAITSADSGDGRSHIAANLAVCLSQAGLRILLIDADLRRPKQHLIFNVPQHPGLSRLLCGFVPKEVVNPIEPFGDLTLITSGPPPPDPLELLCRKELATLMEYAREFYDAVVVDTPAATEFFDTELIASATGVALIIARKNHTRQRKVQALMDGFAAKGIQIAGTLMSTH